METIKTTVYTFNELSDTAKQTAREWYRDGALDYEWYDAVYDYAKECAALLGIEIETIYFSGFSSQGDGAMFIGRYSYAKRALSSIKEHAPQDAELHRIAKELQNLQRRYFYSIGACTSHRGHYYHEMSMLIESWTNETSEYLPDLSDNDEETLNDLLRDIARWIYRALEKEYNYLMSDEIVDETILLNEYTFTENGTRF